MKIRSQKGVSAVEFALVLPVLLLLVFGIIEWSIFLYDKAVITNASREGARAGIVYSYPDRISDADIKTVVNKYIGDHLKTFGDAPPGHSTVIERMGDGSSGDSLTVRVTYRYDFLVFPDLSNLFTASDPEAGLPPGIDLTAETVMRME